MSPPAKLSRLGKGAALLALCAVLALGTVAAQAAPGALDPSFASGGTEVIPFGPGSDMGHAVVVQPDRKIVVAGDTFNGTDFDFALARVNPNGALDNGFGTGGEVNTGFGASSSDSANALALQPDGKLVAAGLAGVSSTDFALARYNANGSLDTSFDGDGKVTTDILGGDDEAHSVAVQPDGKILAAGLTYTGSVDEFVLVRYNANGSLDTGFTGGGAALTPIGSGDASATALALQPDGKIVVVGSSSNGTNDDFAVVRYSTNGGLDSSFGTNGEVTTDINSLNNDAQAVAVQPDGKIVVAGIGFTGGKNSTDYTEAVRYNADGSLDTTFGTGGKVSILPGTNGGAGGVALQPDGKMILAGAGGPTTSAVAVERLNANGSLDNGFGSAGQVLVTFTGGAAAGGVALQPNGEIVAVGTAFGSGDENFALARLLGSSLTVTKTGGGAGTVSSSPAGISCGSTCSAPFAAVPVTLIATPQAGSVFSGWSGGGCSGTGTCHVQLSSDQNVTATFTLVKTLTVTKAGTGSGTVGSSPAGIDCGSTCAHTFPAGTSVTLTAHPSSGSSFTGWSGACTGTGSCKLTMAADHDVTATFGPACIVPKVKGKTLKAAKHAIKAGHCSVGKVTKAFSAHVKKGHVISQKPKPGAQRPAGARVSLKVSKGRRQ